MGTIPTLSKFTAGTPIVASVMNSHFEAIVTAVNGGLDDSNILEISAGKVTSGVFDPDRIPQLSLTHIPRLTEDKLPQAAQGFLKAKGATADPAYELVQWGDVQAKPAQATRWPTFGEVTGKPATYPPTIGTTATTAKAGDYAPTWGQVSGKPSTFTPSAHTHPWNQITDRPAQATRWPAWNEVSGKPSLFAPSAHTHSALDINTGVLSINRIPEAAKPVVISDGLGIGAVNIIHTTTNTTPGMTVVNPSRGFGRLDIQGAFNPSPSQGVTLTGTYRVIGVIAQYDSPGDGILSLAQRIS